MARPTTGRNAYQRGRITTRSRGFMPKVGIGSRVSPANCSTRKGVDASLVSTISSWYESASASVGGNFPAALGNSRSMNTSRSI